MMPISEGVMIALLGLLGVMITAGVGYYQVSLERLKVDQAQLEMRFQRAALSFPEFVEDWTDLQHSILDLMATTGIDRFLILRAWNGYLEPRWTTAMFQMRTEGQQPVAYVHFELDRDYVSLLREISHDNFIIVKTEELPKTSVLKDLYLSEGVTAAVIANIVTMDGPIKGTKAQTYCSFATHHHDGLTDKEITACRVMIGRLKGLSESFEHTVV